MADHLDSSVKLTSPNGAANANVDITDIYIFQKPTDPSKSILILNVNPLAPTLEDEFKSDAAYDMLIDTDGNADADIGYRITFTPKRDGKQYAKVERTERQAGAVKGHHEHNDEDNKVIIEHAPVSFGKGAIITEGEDDHEDYRFFAGFRSDPFFFDLAAFLKGFANGNPFKAPGSDFFIKLNVFGIVLEVPNREGLGKNHNVGYWARTLISDGNGHMIQDDQMGRPAINTVFNHGAAKDLFNVTPPSGQRPLFLSSFVSTLQALSSPSYSTAQATGIADILLPDILTYDYSSSGGFLNGRKLADDVIDAELNLITNGAIKTDFVGPHTDYLTHFPYLGRPHS